MGTTYDIQIPSSEALYKFLHRYYNHSDFVTNIQYEMRRRLDDKYKIDVDDYDNIDSLYRIIQSGLWDSSSSEGAKKVHDMLVDAYNDYLYEQSKSQEQKNSESAAMQYEYETFGYMGGRKRTRRNKRKMRSRRRRSSKRA